MGSSSSKPDLSDNALAKEREQKLDRLMVTWYESVLRTPPPSTEDPNLLRYEAKTDYYYMDLIGEGGWLGASRIYDPPWVEDPPTDPPEISVDRAAIDRTIEAALGNTTGSEPGQGYGTCVVQSLEGKYYGDPCLFKLIVVAVSFNFSDFGFFLAADDDDVIGLGYWIYFFRSSLPFRHGEFEPLAYKLPDDISVVGRKYMTVEELDNYNL